MKNLKKRNDFLSIKEGINNDILDKLAQKIAGEETDEEGYANFDITEYNIDGILFYVTGYVKYSEDVDRGDYYTPPSYDRKFYSCDLEISWSDGEMEDDLPLSQTELDFIEKKLNIYN